MPESPPDRPAGKSDDQDVRGWARQLATLGHVGMMFPVAIAIGFLGGRWLDGRLGTAPWLALIGFTLGIVAALRNLIGSVRTLEGMDEPPETPLPGTPQPQAGEPPTAREEPE